MKIKYTGKKLANFRRSKGFSQKDLADQIGVSVRVISYYENESKYPPSDLLPAIAKVLNISIDKLLGIENTNNLHNPTDIKLWKKIKKIEKLSKDDQKVVLKLIDSLARNKI